MPVFDRPPPSVTYNEAIARNEVSVITNSFAHREDSEPRAVRRQYSASAT